MVCPKGCYGDKYFLTSFLMTWTECTLSKFADDKNLGVVDMEDGCAAIQSEFNRLEKWANRKFMRLNKAELPELQEIPSGKNYSSSGAKSCTWGE